LQSYAWRWRLLGGLISYRVSFFFCDNALNNGCVHACACARARVFVFVFVFVFVVLVGLQAVKHIFFYINDPDREYETVAVLSIALLLLTHIMCKGSASFNQSQYLHHTVRDVITVTGPLLALLATTGLAWLLKGRFWDSDKTGTLIMLDVPESIVPTLVQNITTAGSEVRSACERVFDWQCRCHVTCTSTSTHIHTRAQHLRVQHDVCLVSHVCCVLSPFFGRRCARSHPDRLASRISQCTDCNRPWLVPFTEDVSGSTILIAAVLGGLLALLFFVEQVCMLAGTASGEPAWRVLLLSTVPLFLSVRGWHDYYHWGVDVVAWWMCPVCCWCCRISL